VIGRCVSFCAKHHWAVIIVGLILAVIGDQARRGLDGDVVPDLADPQIAWWPTGWATPRPK